MTVAVRLFAVLRERAGRERIELELPEHATVADALAALAELPDLDGVLARVPVQLAVNRDYASAETELHADDELALIPPLSGGRAAHVAVSERPLELESLSRAVGDPRAGAIVCFQGVTREVPKLQYEAYVEMARERIAALLASEGVNLEYVYVTTVEGQPMAAVVAGVPDAARASAAAGL